jgi:hypothetical protein
MFQLNMVHKLMIPMMLRSIPVDITDTHLDLAVIDMLHWHMTHMQSSSCCSEQYQVHMIDRRFRHYQECMYQWNTTHMQFDLIVLGSNQEHRMNT